MADHSCKRVLTPKHLQHVVGIVAFPMTRAEGDWHGINSRWTGWADIAHTTHRVAVALVASVLILEVALDPKVAFSPSWNQVLSGLHTFRGVVGETNPPSESVVLDEVLDFADERPGSEGFRWVGPARLAAFAFAVTSGFVVRVETPLGLAVNAGELEEIFHPRGRKGLPRLSGRFLELTLEAETGQGGEQAELCRQLHGWPVLQMPLGGGFLIKLGWEGHLQLVERANDCANLHDHVLGLKDNTRVFLDVPMFEEDCDDLDNLGVEEQTGARAVGNTLKAKKRLDVSRVGVD